MTTANTNTMTAEQIRRTEQAIAETYRIIRKESKYLPKFRNQKLIDMYNLHVVKLETELAESKA